MNQGRFADSATHPSFYAKGYRSKNRRFFAAESRSSKISSIFHNNAFSSPIVTEQEGLPPGPIRRGELPTRRGEASCPSGLEGQLVLRLPRALWGWGIFNWKIIIIVDIQ
jgi:hypothetical protein